MRALATAAVVAEPVTKFGDFVEKSVVAPVIAPAPTRRSRVRSAATVVEAPAAEVVETPAADAPPAPVTEPAPVAEHASEPGAAFGHAATSVKDDTPADHADAFEHAARLFAFTGEIALTDVVEKPTTVPTADDPLSDVRGSEPRKARSNFRKIATAGFSVSVMGVIGAFVLSMSMPFMGAPTAKPETAAAASLTPVDDSEIQAFVASSEVNNATVTREGDYSQVTAAQIADETGINYSSNVFTNNRNAAIQWPFAVGVDMSYGYGMRDGRLHEGIDFTPGAGAPIQSIADGVVRIATENGGNYGVTVYVDHVIDGEVITSHYSHMQYGSLAVVEGQEVKVGDPIGLTGNTGRSFGAHLHFELIVNGSTIDPMPWMKEHAG